MKHYKCGVGYHAYRSQLGTMEANNPINPVDDTASWNLPESEGPVDPENPEEKPVNKVEDVMAVSENMDINLSEGGYDFAKSGLIVNSGAVVNISGDGKMRAGTGTPGSYFVLRALEGSEVNISGGEFSVAADENGEGNSCIEAKDGVVNISGGTFKSDAAYKGKYYILNTVQTQGATGKINVTGGTFYGQDPAQGDDNLGGSYVAEGYKSVLNEELTASAGMNVYEVVPE